MMTDPPLSVTDLMKVPKNTAEKNGPDQRGFNPSSDVSENVVPLNSFNLLLQSMWYPCLQIDPEYHSVAYIFHTLSQ